MSLLYEIELFVRKFIEMDKSQLKFEIGITKEDLFFSKWYRYTNGLMYINLQIGEHLFRQVLSLWCHNELNTRNLTETCNVWQWYSFRKSEY